MKKRIVVFVVILASVLSLVSCKLFDTSAASSSFSIVFIDVGHGDAALVECDGHYMLIDGGDDKDDHPEKVKKVLQENGVKKLDYLVISHLDQDHYGGLKEALDIKSLKVKKTFCNDIPNNPVSKKCKSIVVPGPDKNNKFDLGSAKLEFLNNFPEDANFSGKETDNTTKKNNASLVLLIEYNEKKFLFTGDIQEKGQKRLLNNYKTSDDKLNVDLLKVPHHGSYENSMDEFIEACSPDYAVISCGDRYDDSKKKTMGVLRKYIDNEDNIIQTLRAGNITVKSDGKDINISREKNGV